MIRDVVAVGMGIVLAVNAAMMLVVPHLWYASVPGVVEHGPFNAHFIRDIGALGAVTSVVVTGSALLRWNLVSALWTVAALAVIHGVIHLCDSLTGPEPIASILREIPVVYIPAAIITWLAIEQRTTSSRVHKPTLLRGHLRR